MEETKPLRKYGRGRRLWQYAGYYLHWATLLPVWTLLMTAAVLCGLGAIVFMGQSLYRLSQTSLWTLEGISSVLCGFLEATVLSVVCYAGSRKVALHFRNSPPGGLLKPMPPIENPLLPDRDLLVRASGQDTETQKQELLRAAHDQSETPQEELLRVVE